MCGSGKEVFFQLHRRCLCFEPHGLLHQLAALEECGDLVRDALGDGEVMGGEQGCARGVEGEHTELTRGGAHRRDHDRGGSGTRVQRGVGGIGLGGVVEELCLLSTVHARDQRLLGVVVGDILQRHAWRKQHLMLLVPEPDRGARHAEGARDTEVEQRQGLGERQARRCPRDEADQLGQR